MIAGARTFFDLNLVSAPFDNFSRPEQAGPYEASPISSDGTVAGSSYELISARLSANEPYYFEKGPFGPVRPPENIAVRTIMPLIGNDIELQLLIIPTLLGEFLPEEDVDSITLVGDLAKQNPVAAKALLTLLGEILRRGALRLPDNFHYMLYYSGIPRLEIPIAPPSGEDEIEFLRMLAILLSRDNTRRIAIDAFMAASYAEISDETSFGRAFVAFGRNTITDDRRRVVDILLKVATGEPSGEKQLIIMLANEYLSGQIHPYLRGYFIDLLYVFGNYFADSHLPRETRRHPTIVRQFHKFVSLLDGYSGDNFGKAEIELRLLSRQLGDLQVRYEKRDRAASLRTRSGGSSSPLGPVPLYEFPGAQFASVEGDVSTLPAFRAGMTSPVDGPRGFSINRPYYYTRGSEVDYITSGDSIWIMFRRAKEVIGDLGSMLGTASGEDARRIREKLDTIAYVAGRRLPGEMLFEIDRLILQVAKNGDGNSGSASGTPPAPSTPPSTPVASGSSAASPVVRNRIGAASRVYNPLYDAVGGGDNAGLSENGASLDTGGALYVETVGTGIAVP